MDKNLILIHLESMNNIIYRMNPQLFPNIMRVEKEGISFHNYFSTATSTWMVISDLLYGGLDQYEGCSKLEEKPDVFCYQSSLLDDFYDKGYRIGAFVHPFFELPQMREHLLFGKKVKQENYTSYNDFFSAFKTVMEEQKRYSILISNFMSNLACNRYLVLEHRRTGGKRWEDGYRCLDGMVGNIFQILKETGQEENTVVVLYGDHGDDFWGHGFHKGLTHAIEPVASLIHTPLIVWEKNRYGGKISNALVSTTDIKTIVERTMRGEEMEKGLERRLAYSRNAFAGQPVRKDSFNKGYSVTDGKILLLVSPLGLEMYDIEMDPACGFNMLHTFEIVRDRLVFDEKKAAGLSFHFIEFMDENERRYIRQKFYYMRPHLYRYVAERYKAGRKCETEMNIEMNFNSINYNMKP